MYDSTTTVAVGLDVHARSIRLAALRADQLLEERTLPYDEEAVERLLRRWPSVRCCYEAGPTGFGLYRFLVGRGIDCAVVAPGLVPQRPGDRVKTDPRDARKLARCRPRPLGALLRRASPAGLDHQGRQQPRAPAAGRGSLARAPEAEGRLRARPPPTRPRQHSD